MKTLKSSRGRRGFTLIEIMIVIAIIGLLAAIAVPNYVRSRQTAQRNACIKNLQQIDGAKERWALETKQSPGAATLDAEVIPYIKAGRPICPAGGSYTFETLGTDPTCTITMHSL